MSRFVVREASRHEFDDIRAFYEANSDGHIRQRADEVILRAIDEGVFFVAIDTSINDGANRIVAASAVYTIETTYPSGGTLLLKECGGTLVKPEYRGFSLQKIFLWVRSLHKHILDRNGFDHFFCSIRVPNEHSVKNVLSAGFQRWESPPESLIDQRTVDPVSKGKLDVEFYRLPISSLRIHAEKLLAQELRGIVERRNGKVLDQVELHLSIEVLTRYRQIVTMIVDKGVNAALDVRTEI